MHKGPDFPNNIRMQGQLPDKGTSAPDGLKAYSLLGVTGDLRELQEFEKTTSKYKLPPSPKPCILKLLNNREVVETEERWKVPAIIACELKRAGCGQNQVIRRLELWGNASFSEINSAVRVAFEKSYEFGCPKLETLGICLYSSRHDCPWYARIPKKGQYRYRERDFYHFGWPRHLKPSEQCIYFALRELERKRQMSAGSRLFASERELAKIAGVVRKTVRCGLRELKNKGLVKFRKGYAHKQYGIAGEIQRVIPIPKPGDMGAIHK